MMITLSLVKEHLRVTHDYEDTLIGAYMNASLEYIPEHCGRDLDDLNESIVNAAMLLLIADLYENRQAGTDGIIHTNPAVDRLLDTQRLLIF